MSQQTPHKKKGTEKKRKKNKNQLSDFTKK